MSDELSKEQKIHADFENLAELSVGQIGAMPAPGTPGNKASEILYTIIQTLKETQDRALKATGDLNVTIERVAKLEGELDKARKDLETAQKALMKTIGNLTYHTHDKQGTAVVPLAS